MALVYERTVPFDISIPREMLIVTPVVIGNPNTGRKKEYLAMWDTGSTGTCITSRVAAALELEWKGWSDAIGMTGSKPVSVFEADVFIDSIDFNFVKAREMVDFNDGLNVVIGMDIIGNGDFSLTRQTDGSIRMRFQCPPACFSKQNC